MTRSKLVLGVGCAFSLGLSSVALADGIADNKPYVQGFIGAVVDGSVRAESGGVSGSVDTGTGLAIGGAFGHGFDAPGGLPGSMRGEVEISHRQTNISFFDPFDGFDVDADVNNLTGLANLWWDFDLDNSIVPYAGGGIGIGRVGSDGEGETGFAWQIGGGVNMKATEDIFVGLGYRFGSTSVDVDVPGLSADGSVRTHQITANVGLSFQ